MGRIWMTLVTLISLQAFAAAAAPSVYSTELPPILVAVDDWPPFQILGEDEEVTGFDISLIQELKRRTGLKFVLQRIPWSRTMSHMKIGRVDMVMSLAKNTEREAYIDYVPYSYFQCSTVFYGQHEVASKIKSYQDLYGHKIGYVFESFYFEKFNTDVTLEKHGVATEDQLIRMAERNRLPLFIGTDCQLDYEINKRGLTKRLFKADFRPGNSVKLYIGFSKYSNKIVLKPRIENALRAILQDGTISTLAQPYFGATSK